jgi:hypothetical protein
VNVAAWMYPWGVLDTAPAATLDRLASIGVRDVRVAVAYHPYAYPDPDDPSQTVGHDRDAVYIPWSGEGAIRPASGLDCVSRPNWLREVCAVGHSRGLKVSAWIVLCRNTAMADRYPEFAVTALDQSRECGGLCPAQPEVRRYARSLIALCADSGVDQIVIESAGFPPYRGVDQPTGGPLRRLLRGICFCPTCEGERTSTAVRRAVEEGLALDLWDLDTPWAARWLESHLGEELQRRARAVAAFWRELHDDTQRIGIRLAVSGRWPDTWVEGYDLVGLDEVDSYAQLWYSGLPGRDEASWRWLVRNASALIDAGVRFRDTEADTRALLRSVAQEGVGTVVVYNLSRVRLARWSWLATT